MNYFDKEEVFLNVSELEAPEPLIKIIHELNRLDTCTQFLKVEHRMDPQGLYPHLKRLGFDFLTSEVLGKYFIKIWKLNY